MIERRGSPGVLVALCLSGVAACSVATPTATRPGSPASETPAPTAPASGSIHPSSSPSPATDGRFGLGAELDIQRFPRELSGTVLEFISDGSSILFSSSRALDSGPEGAPDLWSYEPGAAKPELVWHNPERNHSIVRIAGDLGTAAFVEVPLTGERVWNLWLVPGGGTDAILLDSHPGDEDVSSLVPSMAVFEQTVAWTAFDRGPQGPVSQLLVASAPDWTPRVIQERLAAEAELWLPSLYGNQMVYTEVRYSADHSSDERYVYLLDIGDPAATPRRLDTSGRATMPLILDGVVLWKEADPGFNMFNWGRMYRYDLEAGEVHEISIHPQEAVNYPSIGERFAAWWGADAFQFGIYDVERDAVRQIQSYTTESQESVLRPYVGGSLLVWLWVDTSDDPTHSELRYAWLPGAGSDRLVGD